MNVHVACYFISVALPCLSVLACRPQRLWTVKAAGYFGMHNLCFILLCLFFNLVLLVDKMIIFHCHGVWIENEGNCSATLGMPCLDDQYLHQTHGTTIRNFCSCKPLLRIHLLSLAFIVCYIK